VLEDASTQYKYAVAYIVPIYPVFLEGEVYIFAPLARFLLEETVSKKDNRQHSFPQPARVHPFAPP
tara:strand:+ start:401 stop:598 length:198 start_codon:yes stop_codon:yes gene_type:complete